MAKMKIRPNRADYCSTYIIPCYCVLRCPIGVIQISNEQVAYIPEEGLSKKESNNSENKEQL